MAAMDAHPRRPHRPPGRSLRRLRHPPALRPCLSRRRQLHPELPAAGPGRPRPRPRDAAAVEPVPVQRDASARPGSMPPPPTRRPGSWRCSPSSSPGRSTSPPSTTWPWPGCTSSCAGSGLCPTAATFGAATFAFAGYMTAQIVHVDLIEGAAWLPWMLLAVHGLTGRAGQAVSGRRLGRVGPDGPGAGRSLLAVALGLSLPERGGRGGHRRRGARGSSTGVAGW